VKRTRRRRINSTCFNADGKEAAGKPTKKQWGSKLKRE
jgi:hypothetical protein